ncbi:MAG: iron ABC transporter permease [Planctomycetota bacterium]
MSRNPRRLQLVLVALFTVSAVLYLGFGPGPGIGDALYGLFGNGLDQHVFIARHYRLPRFVVASFAGAALALAGVVMQAAFRNPLAAPDVIGTSAGAAFGGVLAIVTKIAQIGVLAVPLASLSGAVAVTMLVFTLAGNRGRFSATGLLLAGIAVNTLAGALTSFAVTFQYANYTASSEVLFWLMGGLERSTWPHALLTAIGTILFAALILPHRRDLDLLTLQDDVAHGLGLDAPRVRRRLLWIACGLTAATVANTGGIAFVGLVVPHLSRLVVGPTHRVLLPTAALMGALLLVLGDMVCRASPPDANLRLGVVTALLGAPYFLFLLARHRRGEML